MGFLAPFMMPLLLTLGIALIGGGWLLSHDHRIRKEVRDELEPKIEKCETNRLAVVDANKALQDSFNAFRKQVDAATAKLKAAELAKKAATDKALADLKVKEAGLELEITKLRAVADGPEAPTPKEACEAADGILGAVLSERVRDNGH